MLHPNRSSIDLSAIPSYRPGDEPAPARRGDDLADPASWRGEAERLRTALTEVVALADANGEARQRVVQMQRRALAALSGADRAGHRR